ncbi:hypothetical protein [Hoeflea poritis]|uniref:Thiamine biosynthesis protein ThiF n=1 Tax=Hoeflea poritis TaxID=2993659 RepID=A0ABT4VVP0_9HYPH|nr:hypothetical protein [Hoeflea poritis]MDA4848785.1 hypothetical protein [Hoeflea poritis]
MLDSSTLHRGAKYFMDCGRAATHEEAMALLSSFGLSIHVGESIAHSREQQIALLTLVNLARRSFLAGVEVLGLPEAKPLTRLTRARSLARAVMDYGGHVTGQANTAWPAAVIGDATRPFSQCPAWRLTWSGWRGGIIPAENVHQRLQDDGMLPLAPAFAAACCAAEAFAFYAGDHVMAGHRPLGLSLWKPGVDWLIPDETEPKLQWLPSQLWLIGLGNLGQAFAWLLTTLPYAEPREVKLVLQDDDRLAESNDSTSLLSFTKHIGHRKTRIIGEWLDARGFNTYLLENRFGPWTTRTDEDPSVALCGVDNALARASLERPGFGLVIEAGLGGGPEAFRSLSLHCFPASRRSADIWSKDIAASQANVEHLPAYQAMKKSGVDACGLTQLASRTVGIPFVGLIAGAMVIAELLRRLHGGIALELAAGSAFALDAIETVPMSAEPYAFGHLPVEP